MNTSSSILLELNKISAAYGPIKALYDVSLNVNEGEIVTLIGANGAGKSTLLKSIFGNPKAIGGMIQFKGKNIDQYPTHKISKLGIALVPEGRHIFSGLTVVENLQMGSISIAREHEGEDLEKILDMFPVLAERRKQRAGTLSGGEQQMLAIGRALMGRPKLLLLDEPSLGLAPLIVKQIFEVLEKVRQSGTTVFLVEQNANRALNIADRGYVLANGKIRLSGTGQNLLQNSEIQKAYLGG